MYGLILYCREIFYFINFIHFGQLRSSGHSDLFQLAKFPLLIYEIHHGDEMNEISTTPVYSRSHRSHLVAEDLRDPIE